eukprot:TRINITY_DN12043_c0_g1_i1.p1 TRINITY_DN12043_c0_g1~~TRINITY_DN12043_c0_g1_i1.p1  ORF type:complete len:207 (-),score=49.20 TRINITY_DN12043_c0_g1_i1:29-607(-)
MDPFKKYYHTSKMILNNRPSVINPYELDIRVGKIKNIEKHTSSEKLYVEQIDVGEGNERTIISGLAPYYSLNDLKEKKLLVICNMKNQDIGKLGIISQGMILAAYQTEGENENQKVLVKIIEVPEESKVGDRVEWSGFEKKEPAPQLKSDKIKKILKLLSTNVDGDVVYDSKHFCLTNEKNCYCELKNAPIS